MEYLEILIAAIAAFLLGFVWYTALFGKAWQTESGITDDEARSDIGRTHGLSFLMMLILAYGIKFIVDMHKPEEQTLTHGAFHGLMIAGMFCLPAVTINYLYQKRSLKMYLIDAGYLLSFCAVMGGVLGLLNF
ncbi:MAG: DUF1761 domain-containing protein [Saprospiraceae bacterium]